jgi:PAS domain S-box-containing protein
MASQRSSGQATQTSRSPFSHTASSLTPEIFLKLPLGLAILYIKDPKDVKSYRIVDVNPGAAHLVGLALEDLRGRTLAEFPNLLESPLVTQWVDTVDASEPEQLAQHFRGDQRIGSRVYSVKVFPLSGDCMGVAFEDVTDHRLAEQILSEGERSRSPIQDIQEYALFQLDPDGCVVTWNAGAQRLKGYLAAEIIGKHLSVFYPREAVMRGKPRQMLADASRHGHSEDEGWRIRKDGSRFWANVVITALRDPSGALRGFVKLTRDITERREKEVTLTKAKDLLQQHVEQRTAVLAQVNQELRSEIADRQRAEDQLKTSRDQLRALAARLQTVREEERKSVAREIHDELGQACTAIKMDLALIGRRASKRQTRLRSKVVSAMQLADEMIATLRRISSELRPRTLDDLGLPAALEWQAQEFESRTGIRCRLTLPQDPFTLDPERSTAVFRIFQESLTNVARHSHATRVDARLETNAKQLSFEVHDNGCGLDADAAKPRQSLGLVGMQERALLLNGELRIAGAPGGGTTLTLRIPLPAYI